MHWIRRNWTMMSILVLLLSAGWMALWPPAARQVTGGKIPAPREGFLAPDFVLADAGGRTTRLSDLRGKAVLLNLWASWCAPCQAEMPAMQKAFALYQAQGFTILAVNTTFQDQKADALAFGARLGLTFPILFDETGEVSQKYRVRSMPTSFFIGPDGVIQKVVIGGPMSEGLLRAEIERLLEGGNKCCP